MVIETLINPILDPLKINPTITIIIVSLLMSLVITIMNKYLINQKKAKQIKDEIKDLQAELKKNPDKFGEINKKIMKKTKEQFKLTIKSMIFSLPVALIVFAWLSSSAAYEQINPNENFDILVEFEKNTINKEVAITSENLEIINKQNIENNILYTLKGPEGMHKVTYSYGEENYTQEILITQKWDYLDRTLQKTSGIIISFGEGEIQKDSQIKKIEVKLNSIRPLGGLSIFGWHPGWIASYLIFSIIFTIGLRKVFKTHI